MKKLVIVSCLTLFSVQAMALSSGKAVRPVETKEQKKKSEVKDLALQKKRDQTNIDRAATQGVLELKAMADDAVNLGKQRPAECDAVCVGTLEGIKTVVNDPSKVENDAAAIKSVNELLTKIQREMLNSRNLGQTVARVAQQQGINQEEFIEACAK